jgi:hypothetical protein
MPHQPFICLVPKSGKVRELAVVNDDKNIEIGAIALLRVRLVDKGAAA